MPATPLTMTEKTVRKHSDRKFMALLESAPDSMVITGSDGKIAMLNRQAESLFGYSREEIIGKEIEILMPEKFHFRHQKERTIYNENPRTRPMGAGLELYGKKKDGTEFPVEISLSPMKWDNNETMIIAAIRDVTRQKQDRAELARRTEELEAINRELETFSYSVSHDLRAPLRIIEGFTNKILNESTDGLDETTRGYFARIIKTSRHMSHLIEELLKLARASRTEMMPDCINISDIAKSITDELIASDPLRNAEFDIQEDITVCADANLIRIALQNLFDNAWKFSRKKEKSVIRFGEIPKNNHTIFYVRDNGAGFNMKYAESLFKAFQRLHTVTEFEGTGIGLATVRRIIERHRGEIWAESNENEGSSFYFTLFSK